MTFAPTPLPIVVYHDVLCAWSYVASLRLEALRSELAGLVRFEHRPFPVRLEEAALTRRELAQRLRQVARVREEPEGRCLSGELWRGPDIPCSSLPALVALEAARLQGPDAHDAMLKAMGRAAHEDGLNVTRPDVALELAQRLGLRVDRFAAACASPEARRLVLEEHRVASERGITQVPSLVIGGRWLLSGLQDPSEYRAHILACLAKSGPNPPTPRDGTIH